MLLSLKRNCFSIINFQVCNRYLTQLKDDNPDHPFVKTYQQKENDFDRMVKQYAVTA